jgi:hypothetical protein
MISICLSRRASLAALAAGAALPAFGARANPATQGGPIILTIGGLVGASNREPFDAKRDRFFDHNNLSFRAARTYTAGELAGFPQLTVNGEAYGMAIAGKGPRLHDVLEAASPAGTAKIARLSALDGYAAEIALADIQSQQWILAMEAGGRPFALGDFGPLYAMRQLAPTEKKSEEEAAKWVHSLYYIELMP